MADADPDSDPGRTDRHERSHDREDGRADHATALGSGPDADARADTRLAVCLDLDGTVHDGSAFVTCAVLLPWYVELPTEARERLREAVAGVAAYAGGDRAARRARRSVRAVDALRRVSPRLGLAVTTRLLDRAATRPGQAGHRDYDRLRREGLGGYAAALAGRSQQRVRAGARRIVARHLVVDPTWRRLVARLEAVGDVHLVTETPTHLARPYLRKLGGSGSARASRLPTVDGRFDGRVEPPEKARAVAAIRDGRTSADGRATVGGTGGRGYDRVIAVGDAAVDAAMAEAADLLVAVDGAGDIDDALSAGTPTVDEVIATTGAPSTATIADRGVVRADGAADLERVLEATGVLATER